VTLCSLVDGYQQFGELER